MLLFCSVVPSLDVLDFNFKISDHFKFIHISNTWPDHTLSLCSLMMMLIIQASHTRYWLLSRSLHVQTFVYNLKVSCNFVSSLFLFLVFTNRFLSLFFSFYVKFWTCMFIVNQIGVGSYFSSIYLLLIHVVFFSCIAS